MSFPGGLVSLTLHLMGGGGFHHPLKKIMIPPFVSQHFEHFETHLFLTHFYPIKSRVNSLSISSYFLSGSLNMVKYFFNLFRFEPDQGVVNMKMQKLAPSLTILESFPPPSPALANNKEINRNV